MALEVKILKKLDAFTLDVAFEAGEEVFAVLGESGCGKSMTLKCIAGIETPDSGRICLNGRVLFDSEKRINLPPGKRRVGYLFQDYALFPNLTVEENIGISIPRKERKEKTGRYVHQFFLEGLEKSYPDHLSGGQKQRAAFARMMAAEPEVLLLDEPFSAVDSYLGWQIEKQLAEMLEQFKKTALFVSHDREEVYRFSHRMGIIHRGKMQEIGTKQEIYSHPRTRAAALLTGCKNVSGIEETEKGDIRLVKWGCTVRMPGDFKARYQAVKPDVIGIQAEDIQLSKSQDTKDREQATGIPEKAAAKPDEEICIPGVVSCVMESTEKFIYVVTAGNVAGELRAEMPKAEGASWCRGDRVTVRIPLEKCMLLVG